MIVNGRDCIVIVKRMDREEDVIVKRMFSREEDVIARYWNRARRKKLLACTARQGGGVLAPCVLPERRKPRGGVGAAGGSGWEQQAEWGQHVLRIGRR